jgi:hypothetical protein
MKSGGDANDSVLVSFSPTLKSSHKQHQQQQLQHFPLITSPQHSHTHKQQPKEPCPEFHPTTGSTNFSSRRHTHTLSHHPPVARHCAHSTTREPNLNFFPSSSSHRRRFLARGTNSAATASLKVHEQNESENEKKKRENFLLLQSSVNAACRFLFIDFRLDLQSQLKEKARKKE